MSTEIYREETIQNTASIANVADGDHILRPPAFPYDRNWAVRIVLPGQDETPTRDGVYKSRLTEPLDEAMAQIIDTTQQSPLLESIEYLFAPARGVPHLILDPTPAKLGKRADPDQKQLVRSVKSSKKQAASLLKSIVDNAVPDAVGTELVDLSLEEVKKSPVPTCRVVSRTSEGVSRAGKLNFSIPVRLFTFLKEMRLPFVYQVIIDVSSSPYKVAVRLAVFDPSYKISGRNHFAKHVKEGHPLDLHQLVETVNLTTNFQMPVDDYWDIEYDQSRSGLTAYTATYSDKVLDPDYRYRQTKRAADKLQGLVTGVDEYERLLRGDDNYAKLYENVGFYPRFNVSPVAVTNFVTIPPLYYDYSHWDEIAYRDGFEVITREIESEAEGTPQAVGAKTDQHHSVDTTLTPTRPRVQNDGSAAHSTGAPMAVTRFGERGTDGEVHEQDTSSISDFSLFTDDENVLRAIDMQIGPPSQEVTDEGEADELKVEPPADDYLQILPEDTDIETDIVEGEVEESARSKPANMLDNAARAVMLNRVVLFVFPNEETAAYAMKRLDVPQKEVTDDNAVILYQSTRAITLSDGSHPIHRGSGKETRWSLRIDQLQASDGESIIAEGGAEESVDSFEYDCHRYRKTDGKYVVETKAGEVVAEYSSIDRLTDNWTVIRKPHVPPCHSYLPRSIIMYRDGDDLRLLEPDPEWDVSDAMDRHEGMLEKAVDKYTVEEEGGEIEMDAFRERIVRMYRRKTDWYPPKPHVFGRALPDIETKRRNNPSRTFLKNRRWVYKPGILSPDLPGYDDYVDD